MIHFGSALRCKESSETGAAWPYSFCCTLTLFVEGFDSTKLSVLRSLNSGGGKGLTDLQGRQRTRSKRPNINVLQNAQQPAFADQSGDMLHTYNSDNALLVALVVLPFQARTLTSMT